MATIHDEDYSFTTSRERWLRTVCVLIALGVIGFTAFKILTHKEEEIGGRVEEPVKVEEPKPAKSEDLSGDRNFEDIPLVNDPAEKHPETKRFLN